MMQMMMDKMQFDGIEECIEKKFEKLDHKFDKLAKAAIFEGGIDMNRDVVVMDTNRNNTADQWMGLAGLGIAMNGFGGWGGNRGGSEQLTQATIESGVGRLSSDINANGRASDKNAFDIALAMKDDAKDAALAAKDTDWKTLLGFKDLQAANAECCCTTNRNIDRVGNEISKGTDAVIRNNLEIENREVQRDLMHENQNLRDQLSAVDRVANTNYILMEMFKMTNPTVAATVPTLLPIPAVR